MPEHVTNEVYLDRGQCNRFDVDYFSEGLFSIRADTLLASKRFGYDRHHFNILSPLMAKVVTLRRAREDSPGWFEVVSGDFLAE